MRNHSICDWCAHDEPEVLYAVSSSTSLCTYCYDVWCREYWLQYANDVKEAVINQSIKERLHACVRGVNPMDL